MGGGEIAGVAWTSEVGWIGRYWAGEADRIFDGKIYGWTIGIGWIDKFSMSQRESYTSSFTSVYWCSEWRPTNNQFTIGKITRCLISHLFLFATTSDDAPLIISLRLFSRQIFIALHLLNPGVFFFWLLNLLLSASSTFGSQISDPRDASLEASPRAVTFRTSKYLIPYTNALQIPFNKARSGKLKAVKALLSSVPTCSIIPWTRL